MPQPKRSLATSIRLSRGGRPVASFREVTGLDSEQEVVELREMDARGNPVIRRLPGAAKWPDVTLARGLDTNDELWRWRQSVIEGDLAQARMDCTIEILDFEGNPVAAYDLKQAWPAKYSVSQAAAESEQREGARLSATGDVAGEKLILCHEGFSRQ
jgi:phage tail-like protein